MANWTTVQEGDLDDAATVTSLVGAFNNGNYVHNGLRFQSIDYTNGTFNVTEGKFFVLLDEQFADQQEIYLEYCLLASHIEPQTGLSFDPTTVNHVYARANATTNNSPSITVHTTQQNISDGIRIATIDPSQPPEERVARYNEAPEGAFESLDVGRLNIAGPVTYADGTTRQGAPLTRDSVLNNRNDYYDNQAADPPGVVRRARYAQDADAADHADTATEATSAEYADQAGQLGQYTASDILEVARNTGGEWTQLTDSPIVDSNPNEPLNRVYRPERIYDRYKVSIYAENQFSGDTDIYARINGHTGRNYIETRARPPGDNREAVKKWTGQRQFAVGDIMPDSIAVSEVEFALPSPVVAPEYHHPVFGTISSATGWDEAYTLNGELTVEYDSIERIDIFTDNPVTGRLKIYGQDI